MKFEDEGAPTPPARGGVWMVVGVACLLGAVLLWNETLTSFANAVLAGRSLERTDILSLLVAILAGLGVWLIRQGWRESQRESRREPPEGDIQ